MKTLHEAPRGCGFRKGGGTYLMSDGIGVECDRLPIATSVCPCCGHGIKPARGWTWVEPDLLLEGHLGPHAGNAHTSVCPLGGPGRMGERCGLLWIGESFYPTPESWIAEGRRMGFSRRIIAVPRGFVTGETWVLAAHRKAADGGWDFEADGADGPFGSFALAANAAERCGVPVAEVKQVFVPGIFHVWKPSRIEYVVRGDETDDELAALEKRGIEPVRVEPVEVPLPEEVPA